GRHDSGVRRHQGKAPDGFHHQGPDAPSAHRRPGYPLSGCVPAEPDSVSPGRVRLASTEQCGKPPSDTRVMPQKILLSRCPTEKWPKVTHSLGRRASLLKFLLVMDGSTTLGSGTLNGSGRATISTKTLAVGSHSITAVYGGDGNFIASTSATLNQAVNQDATSTVLSSSVDPSVYGQS